MSVTMVTDPPKTYKCDLCGKEFNRPQSLGAHKRIVHDVAGVSKRSQDRARSRRGSPMKPEKPAPVKPVVEAVPPPTSSEFRDDAEKLYWRLRSQRRIENGLPTSELTLMIALSDYLIQSV